MDADPERVIVVTGASRGAGKGIALGLAGPGTTIYVTGRTRNEGDAPLPGTVQATADEITARGGTGVPVGDGSQPPSHRGFLGDPTEFSDAVIE